MIDYDLISRVYDLLESIANSRMGSMGSKNSHYLPQLDAPIINELQVDICSAIQTGGWNKWPEEWPKEDGIYHTGRISADGKPTYTDRFYNKIGNYWQCEYDTNRPLYWQRIPPLPDINGNEE